MWSDAVKNWACKKCGWSIDKFDINLEFSSKFLKKNITLTEFLSTETKSCPNCGEEYALTYSTENYYEGWVY
jgi:predicted RNA-binding Zn-ribbon protein involved in translation (DUF1610 family)